MDAARQGSEMQAAYANGMAAFISAVAAYLPPDEAEGARHGRQTAIVLLANLVGFMVIARGVGAANPELSAEVLAAGRQQLACVLARHAAASN